ncbi:hypothetical protein DLREEDagr8_18830 [Dongia sp. agr-C8]
MRLGKASIIKPAKHASLFTLLMLVVGLLMDGEYKRLLMAGGAGLILLAGGLVAEWIRPTLSRDAAR